MVTFSSLVSPDGGTVATTGLIGTDSGLLSVEAQSLESSDTLTQLDGNRLSFDLRTSNPWQDRFEFTPNSDDGLCVSVNDLSSGLAIRVGLNLTLATGSFNPLTLEACTIFGSSCDTPNISNGDDRALFSWVDCAARCICSEPDLHWGRLTSVTSAQMPI